MTSLACERIRGDIVVGPEVEREHLERPNRFDGGEDEEQKACQTIVVQMRMLAAFSTASRAF